MKLLRKLASLPLWANGCVLTIGNYDAVHLGHQSILRKLYQQGQRFGLPVVVMTFDPHPQEYFLGENSSARLSDCSTRFFSLQQQGVDIMLLLRFNRTLAQTTAEDFIETTLLQQLAVRYLLIGDDFQFGKGRSGNFSMLQQYQKPGVFEVENTTTILQQGQRISSSRVRELLAGGDLAGVTQLLGRAYNLVGTVTYGQQLGRQWGFPTLNLVIRHKPALSGVFAVQVSGLGEHKLNGVANLGKRPTVGGLQTLLEVHLFNFDEAVYGHRVCVEFIEKIRSEQKFESFDALKAQILQDANQAKKRLFDFGAF